MNGPKRLKQATDDELLEAIHASGYSLPEVVDLWMDNFPTSEEETVEAGRKLVQDPIQGMKIFLVVSKAVEEKREVDIDEYERELNYEAEQT